VSLSNKASKYFIAPSTEALNRFFLENRKQIEILNCVIPLVEKKLYENISDKYKFRNLCNTFDIIIPAEYDWEGVSLPCVAKPRAYYGKNTNRILKPVIIKTSNDLDDFLVNYDVEEFYFQEFVAGKSIYFLYYFYKNNTCLKYSQENLIQQNGGGSILAAKSSDFHLSHSSSKFEKLFYSTNFSGLVMVEIKYFNGEVYMIEANPRFWGPSQLFVDANVNFFEALLYDYELLNKKPENFSNNQHLTYYFWNDGESFNDKFIDMTAFHDYSKEQLSIEYEDLSKINILKREDTMVIHNKLVQGTKNEK
jgi:predicted ATP-grasp superfamily ATP-dependent carboligase